MEAELFAARIRERYPEGLTGVVSIGGTRTSYILEKNRHQQNPGNLGDFSPYTEFLLKEYLNFVGMFLDHGGQNLIMPVLSYQSFSERGAEYTELVARSGSDLTNDVAQSFYRDRAVDPYFAGIDTLLALPLEHPGHRLGVALDTFQKNWSYQTGRPKVIWEVAPIPLFSVWKIFQSMDAPTRDRLDASLGNAASMETMHDLLYPLISKSLYGVEIPEPHFYLGSNRNGDLKLRSMLPIALLCGSPFRLFYTPYPSLFMKPEPFRALLEDLAFGQQGMRSSQKDYSDRYTSEMAEAAYQHFLNLSADPTTIIGLNKPITLPDSKA